MRKISRYLWCSDDEGSTPVLESALGESGVVTRVSPRADDLLEQLRTWRPQLVFLDFFSSGEPEALTRAADLARYLARHAPGLPQVAVCRLQQHQGAMAALRAGIRDIVDPDTSDEFLAVVRRLAAGPAGQDAGNAPRRSVLLLGVRPGLGTTTLAVHLAAQVQARLSEGGQSGAERGGLDRVRGWLSRDRPRETRTAPSLLRQRVALLDLGVPVGDGMLYLNLGGEFHFVEAARSLSRLDGTMLAAAMSQDSSGVSVLSWPADLSQVSQIAHADAVFLLERLREYFGALVIDAGGYANPLLLASLARQADELWLVADQSLGALVSLADMLNALEQLQVSREQCGLVLVRHDDRYGLSAEQISERFELPLRGVLPDHTLALRRAMSQGMLLDLNRRDPYVSVVRRLAARLFDETAMSLQRVARAARQEEAGS